MASTDSQISSQAPAAFHCFGQLPPELQLIIWEFASNQTPPRIFQWRQDYFRRPDGIFLETMHFHNAPVSQHPALASVCKTSRQVAQRTGLRSLTIPPENTTPAFTWGRRAVASALPLHHPDAQTQVLFNADRDIVYLSIPRTSRPESDDISPQPTYPAELERMTLSEVRHIALGVKPPYDIPGTATVAECERYLFVLRYTFPSMQTVYIAAENGREVTFDVVTNKPRGTPWVRDGLARGQQEYKAAAAAVTALVDRSRDAIEEKWADRIPRIKEAWANISGDDPKRPLKVETRSTEWDFTPLRLDRSGREDESNAEAA